MPAIRYPQIDIKGLKNTRDQLYLIEQAMQGQGGDLMQVSSSVLSDYREWDGFNIALEEARLALEKFIEHAEPRLKKAGHIK